MEDSNTTTTAQSQPQPQPQPGMILNNVHISGFSEGISGNNPSSNNDTAPRPKVTLNDSSVSDCNTGIKANDVDVELNSSGLSRTGIGIDAKSIDSNKAEQLPENNRNYLGTYPQEKGAKEFFAEHTLALGVTVVGGLIVAYLAWRFGWIG